MEIPANKSHPRIFSKLAIMLVASFVIFACYELWLSLSSPPTFAKQNQIGVVFQGAMVNHVTGYGMLKPKSAVSLIANVQGAVRTINLKPGANVSKQDVIIELVNPELQRQLEDAELGLLESQSELEKLKIKLQRQSRSLNNNVKIAQGKVRIKQVELEAKKALADKRIISALDFEKSNLELEQTQLALQLAAQELESFEQTRSIELNLAEIQLTKASKKLLIAKQSVQHLKVRSELDGVLIDFERDIQLGQVIKEGTVIGQVADPNSLYAELLISASDAPVVTSGQPVEINIKGESVDGEIVSVSPNVRNNQVQVEVAVKSALPNVARSHIEISAQIVTSEINQAMISPKAAKVRTPNTVYTFYVQPSGEQEFIQKEVQIGAIGNKQMQILSGLALGDKVLLNEPKNIKTPIE